MNIRRRLAKLEGKSHTGVYVATARSRPGENTDAAIQRAILEHRVPDNAVQYVAVMPERMPIKSSS